jgi:hypothetical protein
MMTDFNADNLPLVGQVVIDAECNVGTVSEADDLHNIRIEYKNGGFGLYCLDPECKAEYSVLWLYRR